MCWLVEYEVCSDVEILRFGFVSQSQHFLSIASTTTLILICTIAITSRPVSLCPFLPMPCQSILFPTEHDYLKIQMWSCYFFTHHAAIILRIRTKILNMASWPHEQTQPHPLLLCSLHITFLLHCFLCCFHLGLPPTAPPQPRLAQMLVLCLQCPSSTLSHQQLSDQAALLQRRLPSPPSLSGPLLHTLMAFWTFLLLLLSYMSVRCIFLIIWLMSNSLTVLQTPLRQEHIFISFNP